MSVNMIIGEAASAVSSENKQYYPILFGDDKKTFTITNSGTAPAPAKITLVPDVAINSFTITGVSEEPIIINSVSRNDVIIIDAIDRTVTINDEEAFDHFEGWELPKLQPGVNVINISEAQYMSVSIEYQPRYI